MSRVDARQSHATGDSWRKWEDPVTYAPDRFPWRAAIEVWATCVALGVIAALAIVAVSR